MPVYEYLCDHGHRFDVVKSMSELERTELCPDCSAVAARQISRTNFTGASDWNTQSWNPGLGCYTKSHKHASQIAKNRGLVELGNEKVETVHKFFEKKREETRAERWAEADRVKPYE